MERHFADGQDGHYETLLRLGTEGGSKETHYSVVRAVAARIRYLENQSSQPPQASVFSPWPIASELKMRLLKTSRVDCRDPVIWDMEALFKHAEDAVTAAQGIAEESGMLVSCIGSTTHVTGESFSPILASVQSSHDVDFQFLPHPSCSADEAISSLQGTIATHFSEVDTHSDNGMLITDYTAGKRPIEGWKSTFALSTRTLPDSPDKPLSLKIYFRYPKLPDFPKKAYHEPLIELGLPIPAQDQGTRIHRWFPALFYDPGQNSTVILNGTDGSRVNKVTVYGNPDAMDLEILPQKVKTAMALRLVSDSSSTRTEIPAKLSIPPLHTYLSINTPEDVYFYYAHLRRLTQRFLNKFKDGVHDFRTGQSINVFTHPTTRKLLSNIWPASIYVLQKFDPDGELVEKIFRSKTKIGANSLLMNVVERSGMEPERFRAKNFAKVVFSMEENLAASKLVSKGLL